MSTKFLSKCNGSDGSTTVTDETGKTWTVSGNAQLDTSDKKYGSASLLLDGLDDFIECDHADFALGSGDFTFRCWAKRSANTNSGGGSPGYIFDQRTSGSDTAVTIVWDGTGSSGPENKIKLIVGGVTRVSSANLGAPVNAWTHIELVRSSGTDTLYINGVAAGTYADSNNYTRTRTVIGARFEAFAGDVFSFAGWIDDFELDVGTALHTADFTPPGELYLAPIGTAAAAVEVTAAGSGVNTASGDGVAEVIVSAIAAGAMSASAVGVGSIELTITASGTGGPVTAGYANAVADITASAEGETTYPIGTASYTLRFSAAATAIAYATGPGAGTIAPTASGVGAVVATGIGAASVTMSGAGAGAVVYVATGAATVTVTALGGDYPVATGTGAVSVTGGGLAFVGTASAGRWLYLHTVPPAQVYSIDELRGRLNPHLPAHMVEWSASDLSAEVGRTNDSWSAEIVGASAALRERIASQAPFGIKLDLYDAGDIVRSGVSFAVGWQDRSVTLDVQSEQWTRDLPARSSADLGTFRDAAPLPWRYGRDVPGALVPINQARTRWLWADHASSVIRSVTVGGQPFSAWSWRNSTDASGMPITIVETTPIDDGAEIVATGDGAMDATTGALLVNPADIVRDICRRAGLTVARSDFAALRSQCLARNIELSGTIDGGSLQAALVRISESIHAVFARETPGFLQLLPLTGTALATIPAASVTSAVCETSEIATRLLVRYGVEERGPRRSLEVRAPSVERLRGIVSREIELPLIRDSRAAADVAERMLGQMARPAYRIDCGQQAREWMPGQVAAVSVQQLGISGSAMVQSARVGHGNSTPVLLLHVGTTPTVDLVTVAQAYAPEQYVGATVTTEGGQRIVTITEESGAPIAGARCTLDGSLTRTSDNAGRVAYPSDVMGPGLHTIDVIAAGYEPFRLTVTV